MSILAIRRGLSNKNKMTLRFDISEEQLQALEIWNNRRNAEECVHMFIIHCASRDMNFQRIARKHMLLASLLCMEKRRTKNR
jgi:hypothetical protein